MSPDFYQSFLSIRISLIATRRRGTMLSEEYWPLLSWVALCEGNYPEVTLSCDGAWCLKPREGYSKCVGDNFTDNLTLDNAS